MDFSQASVRIPMEECVAGHLYWINARNAWLGIWDPSEKGFHIRRYKFGSVFEFVEYHWDTGPPHGTATPFMDLGAAPNLDWNSEEFIEYMEEQAAKLEPEGLEEIGWALHDRNEGHAPGDGLLPEPRMKEAYTIVAGEENTGNRLDN